MQQNEVSRKFMHYSGEAMIIIIDDGNILHDDKSNTI